MPSKYFDAEILPRLQSKYCDMVAAGWDYTHHTALQASLLGLTAFFIRVLMCKRLEIPAELGNSKLCLGKSLYYYTVNIVIVEKRF